MFGSDNIYDCKALVDGCHPSIAIGISLHIINQDILENIMRIIFEDNEHIQNGDDE